jgi:hypothetical protein
MSLKEKMMETMIGNMSTEEKKEMMEKMMDKFFSDMSAEDKNKIMMEMMPKMMSSFMGSKDEKSEKGSRENKSSMMDMMGMMMGGKSPMMNMMSMMMGNKMGADDGNEKPWDMCKKMMSSISKSNDLASFATPEIRGLFEEWVIQIEEEFLDYIKTSNEKNIEKLIEHFKLSKESVVYILNRLSQKGKIKLNIE